MKSADASDILYCGLLFAEENDCENTDDVMEGSGGDRYVFWIRAKRDEPAEPVCMIFKELRRPFGRTYMGYKFHS